MFVSLCYNLLIYPVEIIQATKFTWLLRALRRSFMLKLFFFEIKHYAKCPYADTS